MKVVIFTRENELRENWSGENSNSNLEASCPVSISLHFGSFEQLAVVSVQFLLEKRVFVFVRGCWKAALIP